MKIVNGKVFINGKFILGGIEFDEKIIAVGETVKGGGAKAEAYDSTGANDNAGDNCNDILDAGGDYIIPGLVDIHTHAAVGEDSSDGKPEGIPVMARYYAKEGVTSWCPTTMTLKEPELTKAVRAIASYKREEGMSKVAGINLEGPFLSMAKKGAQNADNLHEPDVEMFNRINEASGGIVKLITVAPEEKGAIEFIEKVSKICTVSIGHTAADYETAMAAYRAGASHATHLFNGMPGIHHREPGVIPAALDSDASVELITDGLHIHPSVIRLASKLFGDKLCLISDSLRCAGMPDGEYELGGQLIEKKDGKAYLKGTDTIAGSSIHLMEGLRRCVKFGLPLETAVKAATIAPAKAIKCDSEIGSLEKGKYADLVILNKDLEVKAVYINGEKVC